MPYRRGPVRPYDRARLLAVDRGLQSPPPAFMLRCTNGDPTLPARRFLYVIAGLIMLTLAAAIGWNLFQDRLMRATFVPDVAFTPPAKAGAPDYRQASAWLSRPDLADDPSRWTPAGARGAGDRFAARHLLYPADHLSAPRPLERAARRRAGEPAAAPVRRQPGERVQRARSDLGAALSPGDRRGVPDHQRGRRCRARCRLS